MVRHHPICITAILAVLLLAGLCRAAAPPTAPPTAPPATLPTTLPTTAPAGVAPALWAKMKAIDAIAGSICDLTADFQQRKFTPLLKQPMLSTGTVLAKGAVMLWDTRSPQPTRMRIDDRSVTIYYPQQQTAEVYPLSGQLAQLAASPVPRLAQLLPYFAISPASSRDVGQAPAPDQVAFLLTPTDPSLREHVDHVIVLIDARRGLILLFQLVDADGETTQLRFLHVRTNLGLPDARLELHLPPDTRIVHPMEGLGETGP